MMIAAMGLARHLEAREHTHPAPSETGAADCDEIPCLMWAGATAVENAQAARHRDDIA